MVKRSIFKKYFYFCSSVVLIGTVLLASVLLIVSNQLFKSAVCDRLQENAKNLTAKVQLECIRNDSYNGDLVDDVLVHYSVEHGQSTAVFDKDGRLLSSCSIDSTQDFVKGTLSSATLASMGNNEYYFIGKLDGMFRERRAVYINKFRGDTGETYYLLVSELPESMLNFSKRIFITYVTFAVFIIGTMFLVLYKVIKRLINPIEQIIMGVERYGNGDFSQPIPMSGEGETRYLASSLNRMAESISETEKVRKSFVANVSHELRTPMTSIGGFVDGILSGTIPPEKEKHYLSIVSDEIKRLSRLVRTMLNISKFEAGEMTINYKKFDIADLLIRTVFLFEKNIDAKHVEVEGLCNDTVTVNADEDLMQQVFFNLIENATKFVPIWGTITFCLKHENGIVSIAIKNTGDGLADDELPKIFDRFYKTDESRSKDKNGVGLGLSIVRSIVRLHNGKIIVNSTKGEFSEFVVEIPDGMDSEANAEPAAPKKG